MTIDPAVVPPAGARAPDAELIERADGDRVGSVGSVGMTEIAEAVGPVEAAEPVEAVGPTEPVDAPASLRRERREELLRQRRARRLVGLGLVVATGATVGALLQAKGQPAGAGGAGTSSAPVVVSAAGFPSVAQPLNSETPSTIGGNVAVKGTPPAP